MRATDLGRVVLNLTIKMISFLQYFDFSPLRKEKEKNYKLTNTRVNFCINLSFDILMTYSEKIYKLINTQELH